MLIPIPFKSWISWQTSEGGDVKIFWNNQWLPWAHTYMLDHRFATVLFRFAIEACILSATRSKESNIFTFLKNHWDIDGNFSQWHQISQGFLGYFTFALAHAHVVLWPPGKLMQQLMKITWRYDWLQTIGGQFSALLILIIDWANQLIPISNDPFSRSCKDNIQMLTS